jgi:hypothetical protein
MFLLVCKLKVCPNSFQRKYVPLIVEHTEQTTRRHTKMENESDQAVCLIC